MIVTKGYGSNLLITQGYGSLEIIPIVSSKSKIHGNAEFLKKLELGIMKEDQIMEDDEEIFEILHLIMPIM